jgi:hypothetical protein
VSWSGSQQAYSLAAITERHHEQPRASIFARLRVAGHRASAVINLGLRGKVFWVGFGDHRDDRLCLCRSGGALRWPVLPLVAVPTPLAVARRCADPGGLQIRTGCFSTHTGLLLDAP